MLLDLNLIRDKRNVAHVAPKNETLFFENFNDSVHTLRNKKKKIKDASGENLETTSTTVDPRDIFVAYRSRTIVQELKIILSFSCYSVNSRWTKNCLYLFVCSSFSSRSETGKYCYRKNIEEHLSRRKCRDNSTEIVIFYRDRSLIDDW